MRLSDLDANFVALIPPGAEFPRGGRRWIGSDAAAFAAAQGVDFLCPKCFAANGGAVGTHRVICWSRSRGVPDDVTPRPGRWLLVGTSIDDLTLNADPPSTARSVLLTSGCGWHGFVTAGNVTSC